MSVINQLILLPLTLPILTILIKNSKPNQIYKLTNHKKSIETTLSSLTIKMPDTMEK